MAHNSMKLVKVGYNLAEQHLTLNYMGVEAERLPVEK